MAFADGNLPRRDEPLGQLLRGTGAGFLAARQASPEDAYRLIVDHITHPHRPGNVCFNDWGSYLGELAELTAAPASRLGAEVLSLDVVDSLSDMDVAVDVLNYLAERGNDEARRALVEDILSGQRWHSILDHATWLDDETILGAADRIIGEPWLLDFDDDRPLGRMLDESNNAEVRALLERCKEGAEAERATNREQHRPAKSVAARSSISELLASADASYATRLGRDEPAGAALWYATNPAFMSWRTSKRDDADELVRMAVDGSAPARLLAARVAAQFRPDIFVARFADLAAGDPDFQVRVTRLAAAIDTDEAHELLDRIADQGTPVERCVALAGRARRGDVRDLLAAVDEAAIADLEVLSDEFDVDLWHDMASDIAKGLLQVNRVQDAELLIPAATDIYLEACCAMERDDALEFLNRWAKDQERILEGLSDASDMVIRTAIGSAATDLDPQRKRLCALASGLRGSDAAEAAEQRLAAD